MTGAPIVYAFTIPTRAPNAAAGIGFARFLLSADGQAIFRKLGFLTIDNPMVGGPGKPPPGIP
jgi:ABC-type molybdate transport system substrate-binding protein